MNTFTSKVTSFTSKRGNAVEVFRVKEVGHNGVFAGFGKTVRAFARVCGVEVEVEANACFTAPSAVAKAGF